MALLLHDNDRHQASALVGPAQHIALADARGFEILVRLAPFLGGHALLAGLGCDLLHVFAFQTDRISRFRARFGC